MMPVVRRNNSEGARTSLREAGSTVQIDDGTELKEDGIAADVRRKRPR